MINEEVIRKTEAFLKQKFDECAFFSANPQAKAYRLEHTYRVANIGRKIAQAEGFDETEMVIACLLHDVGYCFEFGEEGWHEHGRWGAKIARPFLESLGLGKDRVDDICYGIAIHVDDKADFEGERTPFAVTVGEADNIDRFDAYRLHEFLVLDGFLELPLAEKRANIERRIARWKELYQIKNATKTADALWQERISFGIVFFEKLLAQLNNSERVG